MSATCPAKGRIARGVESVLAPVDFNEVLSVIYREGQKMSWHDDGEPGLGPVVESLSLGSTATMEWRLKSGRIAPNKSYHLGHGAKTPSRHAKTALSITLSHGVGLSGFPAVNLPPSPPTADGRISSS